MKFSEKRKKWLTKKAVRNCMLISIGVFIISYIFETTRKIISTELPFFESILFSVFGLILVTVWLWIMGFLYPEYMETVFTMLGFEEEKINEDKI